MKSNTSRFTTRILMLAMLVIAVFAFRPVQTQAKTVKTLKYGTKVSIVKKKAAKLKKGTNTITISEGYCKFTAKKTKKYTFTFSNVATVGENRAKDINHGHGYIMVPKRSYMNHKKFSTEGGKATTVYLCTNYSWNLGNKKVSNYASLPKRSAKLKIKKGQTVYLYLWFVDRPVNMTVTIK